MYEKKWYRLGSLLISVGVGLWVYMVVTKSYEGFFNQSKTVQTPYGQVVVTEPVLIELLECPAMERIKKVHQYGSRSLVDGYGKSYTRYNHCVGVWALLRKYGASLEEQVAGLLHDASHTVFSHVGDYLIKQADCKKSYQDDIHAEYLEKQGIGKILAKHGMKLEDIVPDGDVHVALDQDLPDLCADRIEYNIQEGLLAGILCPQDVDDILAHLKFEQGKWFFTDSTVAAKLARVSLYGTRHVWGGPNIFVLDTLAAQALRRALDIDLVTMDDIHYSTDEVVWEKLIRSTDAQLVELMQKMKTVDRELQVADKGSHEFFVRSKFRGVNPLVKNSDGSLKRLTEVDALFADDSVRLQAQLAQGWYIKFGASDGAHPAPGGQLLVG